MSEANGKPDPKTGADPKVGVRPYELDSAGRTEDQVPPLIFIIPGEKKFQFYGRNVLRKMITMAESTHYIF